MTKDVQTSKADTDALLQHKYRYPLDFGETPMHVAAEHGLLYEIKGQMIDTKDVDPRDSDGNTPLHRACARGRIDAVKLLLGLGAEANAVNFDYKTPLDLAAEFQNDAVADLLDTYGGGYLHRSEKHERDRRAESARIRRELEREGKIAPRGPGRSF